MHFNPLPPHGGRPCASTPAVFPSVISIHSLRMEGDNPWKDAKYDPYISIHSLRMEGDIRTGNYKTFHIVISIHSLRMEGDATASCVNAVTSTFQSTPSAWRETEHLALVGRAFMISIHSLRMEGD